MQSNSITMTADIIPSFLRHNKIVAITKINEIKRIVQIIKKVLTSSMHFIHIYKERKIYFLPIEER